MRRRRAGRAAIRAGAAIVVAASAASTAAAQAGPAAARAGTPPALTGRALVLINGDRLVTGGRFPRLLPGAASPAAAALLAMGTGSSSWVVPAVAVPFLGRGLDPALFRVASLASAEAAGRLPVTVSYRGPVPSLPGVVITGAAGGTARGYLTAAGARAFGAALVRQFAADHARASYGRDGMFGGGVSVRLAGSPAGAARAALARHPVAFPMRTLTVTGTNLAGKPDTGDVVAVFNTDRASRFADPVESQNVFDHGATRFSVPAGHYWVLGLFPAVLAHREFEWRLPILPQVTVAGSTTVHIAERAADSQIRVITPRPAVPVNESLELRHTSARGPASLTWFFGGYSPVFLSPTTRRATVGTLQAYVFEQLFSPAGAAGTPYEYDVAYADTGLLPPQRYVVRPAGLATVRASYYADAKTTGAESRFGVFPDQWATIPGVLFLPRKMPRRQTEYLTGNPAVLWDDTAEQYGLDLAGGQADALRTFRAGQQARESWNAYPLHEGYNTDLIGPANRATALPSASRAGNVLTVDVMPFSDSTPGHLGASGFYGGQAGPYGTITGRYRIDENGKLIASGNPLAGFKEVGPAGEFHAQVTLSPSPSTVRLVLDASRTAPIYPLSTASRTVWTWRSAHEAGARLPAGWGCVLGRYGTATGHACAVQPMMTLAYAVRGLSLAGSAPPGRQVVHVTAGHLQLATAAAVTRAAVSVSFDGGKTWRRAKVTGHGGSYAAAFRAPAGVTVSLRSSAADAAGGAVTETILNAYQAAP